jgi:hypothetical protein
MNKLKVNRKHHVPLSNIEKFVYRDCIVWVYRKVGYPKVYKTDYCPYILRNRLVNLGYSISDFKVEER